MKWIPKLATLFRIPTIGMLLSASLTCACQSREPSHSEAFRAKLNSLYAGSIPLISSGEANAQISSQISWTLLDTRSLEEYQVSRIPGAIWADYDHFPACSLPPDKSRPILVYCTVGYRSEKVGEKLKKMGYEQVYNLDGGIISWGNQNFPLEDLTGKPTRNVHTYNRNWSKWLLTGNAVY